MTTLFYLLFTCRIAKGRKLYAEGMTSFYESLSYVLGGSHFAVM